MSTITPERLAALAIAALERTAFLMVDPVDPECEDGLAPPTRAASIRYAGPSDGEIMLIASGGFLRELASSMLGVEPDEVDEASHGDDAIKELANIMGGSVILELGGADCAYSLELPRLTDATPPRTGAWCALTSDGETLRVHWAPSAGAGRKAA